MIPRVDTAGTDKSTIMPRVSLLAVLSAVLFVAAMTVPVAAQDSPPAGQITFADESQMLNNKPPKPKELGEKGDPAYLEWPFDVIFLDINGDGKLDLFMMDHHGPSYYRIWLGDGKGKMTDVPNERLVLPKGPFGCFSLLAYDFSGTGPQDVFNTYLSQQFHFTAKPGDGSDKFAWEHTTAPGVWTIMLSDFNGDGNVDIAAGPNRGPGGDIFWGEGKLLAKEFTKKTEAFVGFHSATADMNGDGWPDMVSSNFGETKDAKDFWLGLLINDGKGGFKDMAEEAGLIAAPAGGAVILEDFNNDGLMDIYLCGYPSTKKNEGAVKLYLNEGNGKFRDATKGSGLEGPKDCWQTRYVKATAADFDNDGLIDIVMYGSTGYKLYRNLGNGKFEDVTKSAGIPAQCLGEPAMAAADYNDDGLVDLAMLSGGVWLGRNTTKNDNCWLKVRVIGPAGNPEAAGASVTLYQAGHLGDPKFILGHQQAQFSSDYHTTGSHLHFGLGKAATCDVKAVFPGGKTAEQKSVKAGSRIELKQPN